MKSGFLTMESFCRAVEELFDSEEEERSGQKSRSKTVEEPIVNAAEKTPEKNC